ncbi:class I SAM-dependent methyltransferase [Mycobacterium arosiense]|uniref:SAM-dependent methyltransferase n=1 Tax=Mycobacterium arosiense ATCC BAA-1401 = DSM 45069 TaxID=1265311 RepID=A0A1W9ZBL7_MYCAI|nr:class I SAM-dependent methyltransferase [Mycobacterium arosiense]ORA11407.1 SAM-dependent methyltransferase [Mycobacterium arosiense ATCC BAA-1401 = DSM 45069]
MIHMDRMARDIATMPRGGPDASWLDRRLRTDRLEYLDRDDVDDLKRRVIQSLDRSGRRRFMGTYKMCALAALDEVPDVPAPKILELGCGLGGLSRKLLELNPAAQVTVTDIDPEFVASVASSDLGSDPRATVREMDATAIDASDGHYDLAVFALSLHHLAPDQAARVFAEGTRVARKLLVIDLRRWRAPLQLVQLTFTLPFTGLIPSLHDAVISSLRAYSPSALRAIAAHADPAITVEFRTRPQGATAMVARRAPAAPCA